MADESTATPGDGGPESTPADNTPQSADTTPQPADKTFTQDDIDRIVNDRLSRERQKYADYKDLKAAAEKLKQLEDAQLSEQERLQKQLDEAQKRAETAEQTARQQTLSREIVAQAAKLNFHDPADAIELVKDIEFDDDGKPKGVEAAVKKLAEQRPYLVKKGQSLEPFDPSRGQPQRETDAQKRARLYGGGTDFWNSDLPGADMGGGVIWPSNIPPSEE